MDDTIRQKIENARLLITDLTKEQDETYKNLMTELNNFPKEKEDFLWDYCFNCPSNTGDLTNEYANRLRSIIYGDD